MHVETVAIGDTSITIETGRMARQSGGAAVVRERGSFVLATAVAAPLVTGIGFAPLTVEYQERMAATGRIPTGGNRRELRNTDAHVLAARLIDRSLRPLFHAGILSETQVLLTVFAADPRSDMESLSLIAAAAAVHLSDLPVGGPVAGLRIVRAGGAFHLLPTPAQRGDSDLDLIVTVSREGVVMLEGRADALPEAVVLDAVRTASDALLPVLDALGRLRQVAGRPRQEGAAQGMDAALLLQVRELSSDAIDKALDTLDKRARHAALDAAENEVAEVLAGEVPAPESLIRAAFREGVRTHARARSAAGRRIAGRGPTDIRPISAEVGLLETNHGSALFTRGQTQTLVSATLAPESSAYPRETLHGREIERFLLHYNFPPSAAGEAKPMRGPARREIGHGNLARMALLPVVPDTKGFPFVLRVVSDVLEADGSSSMATVCGASLALMDAGVPIRTPVAGLSLGLFRDGDHNTIVSDITDEEDQLGDMDFKVAGTAEGITAMQLDNKLGGLDLKILAAALEQAQKGRLHILQTMAETLSAPRRAMSRHAPQFTQMEIDPRRIGRVIGTGGKTIQEIKGDTHTQIQVEDDGRVLITGKDPEMVREARRRIEMLTLELRMNGVYVAQVKSLQSYGVFVNMGDHGGLVHISELDERPPSAPGEVCQIGDEMLVRVIGVDDKGRLRLSRRAALAAKRSEALNA